MHEYTASLHWQRGDQKFTDNRYSRRHLIRFDGGAELPASSSPLVVRAPWSDPAAVDPEEMFVASLSSCHMLWFLSLAAGDGYCVDRYVDEAFGVMAAAQPDGAQWMAQVTLRPVVAFSGERRPDQAAFEALHHRAHAACFIANSVRSELRCQPTLLPADA